MTKNYTHSKELLAKIADHLIINSSFLDNLGLLHGKMGIVIFFYHYSQYTNNDTIHKFADEILMEVLNEIHDELPVDFANGYCGIGWAIELLLQNNFIEGDSRDILKEVDTKIMERDVSRIADNELFTGIEGVLHYVLFRLSACDNNTPFDKKYLSNISYSISKQNKVKRNTNLSEIASKFLIWDNEREIEYEPYTYINKLLLSNKLEEDIINLNLGLIDGLAGMGLKIILNENEK
jgi:hypothetical protein